MMQPKNLQVVRKNATRAFRNLGPRNPLQKLNQSARDFLYSALELHAAEISKDDKIRYFARIDGISKIAIEAGHLSSKLKQDVFGGTDADLFQPFISEFSNLPAQLARFSRVLREAADLVGKPGHKEHNFRNLWLIVASEYVRICSGQHYDEHLAELYQSVLGERSHADVSGDAIRKKRTYLAKNYRELFDWARRLSENAFESMSKRTSTGEERSRSGSSVLESKEEKRVSSKSPRKAKAFKSV